LFTPSEKEAIIVSVLPFSRVEPLIIRTRFTA
jgi:hypothetical protein